MRFINCPNCLSSHPDEHTDGETTNGQRRHSLNHRTFGGRLHHLTKALFSPNRHHTFATQKSKEFDSCMKNTTIASRTQFFTTDNNTDAQHGPGANSKYRLERKHKIKKRDLVKQYQRQRDARGNKKKKKTTIKLIIFDMLITIDTLSR